MKFLEFLAMLLEDELGDILEKARHGKGFSQRDLACASGVGEEKRHNPFFFGKVSA